MNIPPDHKLKRYLGDGVYASHDGYQAWLHAEHDGRTHSIALDPEVMKNLSGWAEHVLLHHSGVPIEHAPEQI